MKTFPRREFHKLQPMKCVVPNKDSTKSKQQKNVASKINKAVDMHVKSPLHACIQESEVIFLNIRVPSIRKRFLL